MDNGHRDVYRRALSTPIHVEVPVIHALLTLLHVFPPQMYFFTLNLSFITRLLHDYYTNITQLVCVSGCRGLELEFGNLPMFGPVGGRRLHQKLAACQCVCTYTIDYCHTTSPTCGRYGLVVSTSRLAVRGGRFESRSRRSVFDALKAARVAFSFTGPQIL